MRVSHPSRSAFISSRRISSLVTSRHLFRSYPLAIRPTFDTAASFVEHTTRSGFFWNLILLLGIAWFEFRFSPLQKVLSSRTPFIHSLSVSHSFAWTFFSLSSSLYV